MKSWVPYTQFKNRKRKDKSLRQILFESFLRNHLCLPLRVQVTVIFPFYKTIKGVENLWVPRNT